MILFNILLHTESKETNMSLYFPLEKLPLNLFQEVFSYLNLQDLDHLDRVSKLFHEQIADSSKSHALWTQVAKNIGCPLSKDTDPLRGQVRQFVLDIKQD